MLGSYLQEMKGKKNWTSEKAKLSAAMQALQYLVAIKRELSKEQSSEFSQFYPHFHL